MISNGVRILLWLCRQHRRPTMFGRQCFLNSEMNWANNCYISRV